MSLDKALKILEAHTENYVWMNANPADLLQAVYEAMRFLDGWEPLDEPLVDGDLRMRPRPDLALQSLRSVPKGVVTATDVFVPMAEAVGYLRGYQLRDDTVSEYVCGDCGARGVKLWRAVHDSSRGWCSKCGTAQAGLPDEIDSDGRHPSKFGGMSDQIYNPEQGTSLLPFVPAPDGETWGYTSVPSEGCLWWRHLPTRLET